MLSEVDSFFLSCMAAFSLLTLLPSRVLHWSPSTLSLPVQRSTLGPFMWVHRPPFSHRWMCFCEKSRNGCHFSWHSGETNKPPPQPSAPLRKLAQAPPIGHKHYRVRSTNSLKKAKHSAFHAESPAWPTLASTGKHKSGKVQSKWHTLGLTDVCSLLYSFKKVQEMNESPTNWVSCHASTGPQCSFCTTVWQLYSFGTVGNVPLLWDISR